MQATKCVRPWAIRSIQRRAITTYANPPAINPSYYEDPQMKRLPIPPLEDTCARYLRTLEPLLAESGSALTYSKKVVAKFLKEDGPLLHKQLQRLDRASPTSWLEGFWDSMYLELRDPLTVNVSPFFMFKPLPQRSQAEKAAALVGASLRFIKKLDTSQLSKDSEKTTPLCMSQYPKVFSATRIPAYGRDYLVRYTRPWGGQTDSCTVSQPISKHIIIICRNHLYSLQVISDDGLKVMPEKEIQKSIQEIIDNAPKANPQFVGYLTSENRDTWATGRNKLEANPANLPSFAVVDSALFVVNLDEDHESIEKSSNCMLHNWGHNRWYDKTIQLIVSADGYAGCNMEHAGFDGHTLIRYLTDVYNDIQSGKNTVTSGLVDVHPTRIPFDVKSVEGMIDGAIKNTATLSNSIQTKVIQFRDYGKKFITNHKLSPDGYVQAAYQLAYYSMENRLDSTYESAMTKQYYHGRTECLRTVSSAMLEFVKACKNSEKTVAQRKHALRAAVEMHVTLMNECKEGRGERTLFGMLNLARHNKRQLPNYKIPEIFTDPAYSKMMTSVLSTSNCGTPALDLFGFGPVVLHGLGIGYMIEDGGFNINLTSFLGRANEYGRHVLEALDQMKTIAS